MLLRCTILFTFPDSKNKLDSLEDFLTTNYGYKIGEAKRVKGNWELAI